VRGVDVGIDDVQCVNGELDREGLRQLLLTRSAEQVYLNGADAFMDEAASNGDASILSPSGAIRATLDSVGSSMHDRMTTAAWVLGGVSVVLLLILLLLGRGIRRFAGLGLVLVLAAFPTLLGAGVLWFAAGMMDADGGLTGQFAEITRSLIGLPFRNALLLAAAGVGLIVPVLIIDTALERSRQREWWEYNRQR
jgi:hypothetical protein